MLLRISQQLQLLIIFTLLSCSSATKMTRQEDHTIHPDADTLNATNRKYADWKIIDRSTRPSTDKPAAREDVGIVFDEKGNRFVLVGGKDENNNVLNETWFYYPAENRWERLTQSAQNPPRREDHVVIYDILRNTVILHGGEDGDTSNELWELNLDTGQWIRKTADSNSPYIEDHMAVYSLEQKGGFFFGGQNESEPTLNDLWFLNLDPQSAEFYQWKKIVPEKGKLPEGRINHTMIYDEFHNRLLVYGGWDKYRDQYTTDIWQFSIENQRWDQIKAKVKNAQFFPPPRRQASSVLDKENRLWIIFGGEGEGGPLNDTWIFDLDTDLWQNLTPGPPPRTDHTLIYNPAEGYIYLYGGDQMLRREGTILFDMWKLRLENDK